MSASNPRDRCRIVLVAPEIEDPAEQAGLIGDALSGGDVASVILIASDAEERRAQSRIASIVEVAHARDVAVIAAAEPRLAVRAGADGIHFDGSAARLAEIMGGLDGRLMVGAGGARTRHEALDLGEARPDYLFFGRFGFDSTPEAHPRNLALGQWWAEMIEIPCIVQAGSSLSSIADVAATGAEFVALGQAVFDAGTEPARRVEEANALLEGQAPRLESAS
jgi:thiamine-phosphate pyrophosphorylase